MMDPTLTEEAKNTLFLERLDNLPISAGLKKVKPPDEEPQSAPKTSQFALKSHPFHG
jgi:hypothetical protein